MPAEEEAHDAVFDRIMESVGDNGHFQKRFNLIFNIGLVLCASMAYMNVILALSVPDHECYVPGIEFSNFTVAEWRNLTLPIEKDNRGVETFSSCKMYNIRASTGNEIFGPDSFNFTEADISECKYGYEYDKQWYDRTTVTDENWVCERDLYVTNTFVFNRVGEVFGTFLFGQLGDTLGRRPVFYMSTFIIVLGRAMLLFSASIYYIFAIASVIGSLTSMSIFLSPLIIAMETSKGEDRAHIAMMQCIGWTVGMCIMPLIFWATKDWVWFLVLTTLPCVVFVCIPKYMIESPRWLATKGRLEQCAIELQRIAKLNGIKSDINAKYLKNVLPNTQVETVYGMASLFSGWRLAKNTILIVTCWICASITYFTLILNSSKMGGNPFLNFLYQSAVELPAYYLGRYMGDKIGRRFTNSISFLTGAVTCIPIIYLLKDMENEFICTLLSVFIKFCISITFFVVNLQAMETYPTCLRQTGISIGAIVSNALGSAGPYIVYLGTNYDVRYPFLILGVIMVVGGVAAFFLPETLHHKLPETLAEAQVFGKEQSLWSLPKKKKEEFHKISILQSDDNELLEKLNQNEYSP